jgi:cell wall-associated NlpC family hydrolase
MAPTPPYLDLLGIPFERGGRGPATYDCYGLAREMFRRDGVTVPDFQSPGTLEEIGSLIDDECKRWRRVEYGTLKSLVTFRVEGFGAHVGYIIAPDRFIHAFQPTGVTTERLTNGTFKPLGFYLYE